MRTAGREESSQWLTYTGCLRMRCHHQGAQWSGGGGDWLRLAEGLPGAESSHLLCFGISISPHPMGYKLNHLEMPELTLRDSAAKFRTVPKPISLCKGKSLTRKDLFWPLGESHHFCPSGKGCALLRSCQLLLLKSCLLQGPCGCGFLCLSKAACCPRDANSTQQVTKFSTKSHLRSLPESYL